ncbi:MAG: FISUMP domain-containing protein [Bacteroidales bacterium]|nr:FISUMP domain-containing protein [Bacteroidales bacterium]
MRPLYKIVMLFACVACCANAFAQIRTVTFTGRDRTNQYHIPLSRVNVFNLDQLWEEVLYYPDTVLILGTVGVEDYDSRQNVQLMQNVPNPFDGTTEFALQLPDGGDVFLEIYDITGKLAVAERFTALTVGTHLFQATLSSPQTYLLSAKVDNGKMTIKMVNEGHGAGNTIHHLGMTDKNGDFTLYLKNDKASSSYPFHLGDEMQYEGFALLDGTQWESAVVTQPQVYNDTVPLLFDVTVPTVQTSPVADITASTATCGGVVTSDGNVPVTARGVCWDTLPNPTVDDSFTADSTGVGSFTSHLSGLTDGTTYYVRAYATNSVGTAYGEEREFSTLLMLSPTVTTNTVTDVTVSSATCGGVVTSDGNVPVTARGVCWDTLPNPTVDDNDSLTFNGSGIGSFTSMLSGLAEGTTYYVRAYAINSVDTAYGEQKRFTTQILPSVITDSVSNITTTSAECGGKVVSQGSSAVLYRGVCWSISQNPTVDDSHTTENGGVGSFTSSITGLYAGVRYYVRAYATSSAGTAYGAQVTFVTTFTCGSNTVSDHEGNAYHTVQIGNQCWTKDNLRTTTSPSTGTYLIPASGTGYTFTGKQARWYNNDSATYAPQNYGLLYNWNAAVDTFNTAYGETSVNTSSNNAVSVTFSGHRRGICPAGWHLPSDAEWTQLTDYVSSQSEYTCSGNSSYIAKALASTEGWNTFTNSCAVGNNQGSNNATGFSAVPAGFCYGSSFDYVGVNAYFWSYTQYGSSVAWYRYLSYYGAGVRRYNYYKSNGFSVRCLRDTLVAEIGGGIPIDTTNSPSDTTTTLNGMPCFGTPTITDIDGNTYNTVQIGGQCWMRENLRTTRYADGTVVLLGADTSSTTAYRYNPSFDADNVSTYGYHYNWKAVMRNSFSSNANPSGVQGICPDGWHVPSRTEWVELTTYLSGNVAYYCEDSSNIAKSLSSTLHWVNSTNTCAVGNNRNLNNTTGFGALPAGCYVGNNPAGLGPGLGFASNILCTTESYNDHVWWCYIYYGNANVSLPPNGEKSHGYSVRCLRD